MTKEESAQLWEDVKANHAKLDACVGPHDFSIPYRAHGTLVMDWECTKCHGYTCSIHVHWYKAGLAHGSHP